jgi:hypothetical protein
MNLRYDVVVCGIFILTSTPAWTSECCKLQSNIELPGPAIGSAFECEIGDECSLQIDNVEVGVTSGVISWKELKGNYGVYPLAIRNLMMYRVGHDNEAPLDRSILRQVSERRSLLAAPV